MEVILIILTSAILIAINSAFFALGYFVGKKNEDVLTVDNYNKDAVRAMNDWINYSGR